MVSIVVTTKRSTFKENIIQNYLRQVYEKKELIVILNDSSLEMSEWEHFNKETDITIVSVPNVSLGEAMNVGVRLAKYDVIAKFDDDDYYAPSYLTNSISELLRTKADLVGKASIFIYFERKKILVLYKPTREKMFINKKDNKENQFLFGGTFVFRKRVWQKVKFRDIPNGIDHYFCQDCLLMGFKLYATDPYQFIYCRYDDKTHHTSHSNHLSLIRRSVTIKKGCKISDPIVLNIVTGKKIPPTGGEK